MTRQRLGNRCQVFLTRLIAALLVRPAKEAAIATGVLKTQVSGEN
jgi:hypothetical protein